MRCKKKMDAEWATASSAVIDRLRRLLLPKDFPKRAAAEQRRISWMKASDDVGAAFAAAVPFMKTAEKAPKHRHKDQLPLFPACVARPVSKSELFSEPDAVQAMKKEWGRLWDKKVWDHDGVREWSDVAREAANQGKEIHMGRLFGICV